MHTPAVVDFFHCQHFSWRRVFTSPMKILGRRTSCSSKLDQIHVVTLHHKRPKDFFPTPDKHDGNAPHSDDMKPDTFFIFGHGLALEKHEPKRIQKPRNCHEDEGEKMYKLDCVR